MQALKMIGSSVMKSGQSRVLKFKIDSSYDIYAEIVVNKPQLNVDIDNVNIITGGRYMLAAGMISRKLMGLFDKGVGRERKILPLILFTMIGIFLAEALIMIFLAILPPLPTSLTVILDSILIVAIVSPLLHTLLIKPLIQEITARKAIEESLKVSEERFRTVADFTFNWEYWISPEGNFIYISPSCERISGYNPAELKKDPGLLKKIIHPDDLSKVFRHIENELTNEKSFHLDFRIITKSGETRWINHSCQMVYGEKGDNLGRCASNMDITERKEIEKTLIESEKLCSDIVKFLPMHLAITDSNGIYRIWNKYSEKMFGYKAEDVIDKMTLSKMMIGKQSLSRIYEEALSKGIFEQKYYLVHKNGRIFSSQLIIVPVIQEGGEHTGFIEFAQDLTTFEESKRKIKDLSHKLDKHQEQERKRLSAELHDEANVAITAIKLYGNIIKELISLNRYDEVISQIDNILNGCDTLASELRRLCYNLYPADIDKTGLVYAVQNYLDNIKEHSTLTIKADLETSVEDCDIVIKKSLYRIIQECITNIIRHSQANKATVKLSRIEDKIILNVFDNGIGFEETQVTENNWGIRGIKSRIEDLGGRIKIASKPGKGSNFKLEIPII